MKSWFFEKINELNKHLAKLRRKRKDTIINTKNKRGYITADLIDIEWIVKEYYEYLIVHKLDNQDKVDQFFERHTLPKFTQEKKHNLNRPISIKHNESIIKIKKKTFKRESIGPRWVYWWILLDI